MVGLSAVVETKNVPSSGVSLLVQSGRHETLGVHLHEQYPPKSVTST